MTALHQQAPIGAFPNQSINFWVDLEKKLTKRPIRVIIDPSTNKGNSNMNDVTYQIDRTGNQVMIVDGVYHNQYGPAVISPNGTKYWFQHGKLHRIGGPAVERPDGSGEHCIDGDWVSSVEC